MPLIDVTVDGEIEIEVYCDDCGDGLCNQARGVRTYKRDMPSIRVKACQTCINMAVQSFEINRKRECNCEN